MSNLDALKIESMENDILSHIDDRNVHQGILNMCNDMVEEDPSLKYTILGGIILSHKECINECNITIQYLQEELKNLKKRVDY